MSGFIQYMAGLFLTPILAYLIGSIPFGLLLGKAAGMGDIRNLGSGNIGATNMLRTGNRTLALATLLLDMLKGTVAVILCTRLTTLWIGEFCNASCITHREYMLGLCAVVGHVFPLWLNFKGGKGVATTIGVFFAIAPAIALFTIVIWAIVFYTTRYSSLSAIISLAVAPIVGLAITPGFALMALLLAILVIAKHKDNIKRLKAGTETKWSSQK